MNDNVDDKIEKSMEFKILDTLDENDVDCEERVKILSNLLALICLDHGLPFEQYKIIINELMDCYEETWPIG